ncbi:MAG TPA: monovalent cation/H(+) antiporter subunit G [Steroidobacteraceae bacterium]|nr:monovalent cation/H(+) antiporter subunit G [Steroidobacteraceae bacterium]
MTGTLSEWIALPAALLLILGGLLALIGACGLFRLRRFYQRMHPVTMGATLGTGCILISSMLVTSAILERPVIHELVITLLVVITAPVSAVTLMRAAIRRTRAHQDQGHD